MGVLPPVSSLVGTVPLMSPAATSRAGGSVPPAGGIAGTAALTPDSPVLALWKEPDPTARAKEAIVVSLNLAPYPSQDS